MAEHRIAILNRIAVADAGIELVCNNPTDTIRFEFDGEWDGKTAKTARFSWEGKYIDVPFTGNVVQVPEIFRTNYVCVGVYADNITSTPTKVKCRFSVKCLGGKNEPPKPDVYEEIIGLINDSTGKLQQADAQISEEVNQLSEEIKNIDRLMNKTVCHTTVTGSMTDGTVLSIAENNAQKKNVDIIFAANITTFGGITIGIRHPNSGTLWNRITIDNQNLTVYAKAAEGIETHAHGLTIANNIQVHIRKNYNLTADVTLVSNGVSFTKNVYWGDCVQITQPFAKSDGSVLTDCKLVLQLGDCKKRIWAFGDSYFNYSQMRWVYYADEAGYTKNMMLDAHPGESSASCVFALQTALKHGTPDVILWCSGMNDGNDSDTEPVALWTTSLNQVIAFCEEIGIELVLATIPTCPNNKNEMKNAWVRGSGYRYVDFAKAVGATAAGVWYSGMLSSDNLHPTAMGAKALFMQACADFPDVMIE